MHQHSFLQLQKNLSSYIQLETMYVKKTPTELSCWPAAPPAMGVLGFHRALPGQLNPDMLEPRSYSAPASLR